ncbi:protein-export chaperone SecB [Bacillus cereus]|uniref:protein-export chaperone SecB n=1 Tax=Bacillus cereus TaxID=1396 RepID=UPI000BF3E30B|nr:protein-export chaperone SecB [Bacillus cereus]PEQ76578.1 hypothetical protein CN482_28920 [Bacillus cereus]PEY11300.1 hypothetical protein CN342_30225 [Bacillus cereus]PFM73863.1 hypothetical protein COJ54_24635 [Bacillus cereus]
MSNNMSLLTFNGYSVDNFTYKRNYNFDESLNEDIKLKFKVNAESKMNNEKTEAIAKVCCTVFDQKFSNNKAPFFLEISISGHFEVENKDDEMTMEAFELNAVTILLPYLRSCITSFTAQAGISPVILPPVNVFQIMEEKNNK